MKPSVEIWQNWFNDEQPADLRASKYVDLAYLEFADPFRELFLNGDGDYTVEIRRNFAPLKEVILQYPAEGWSYSTEERSDGICVKVSGKVNDRLLALR